LGSGCGPLGLLVIAVAKAYGVAKIIAFDIEQSRIDFAVKHGADIGVLSAINTNSEEPLSFATTFINNIIKQENLGSGVDLSIEASGAEACVHMGVVITKPGGTCKVFLSESLLSFTDRI
jgi:D-xylulose reductase